MNPVSMSAPLFDQKARAYSESIVERGGGDQMTEKSDAFLFEWAVRHAGHDSRTHTHRWVHVMELFGLGSTSATELCRRFQRDPDEMVGGCCEMNAICVRCDPDVLDCMREEG